MFLPFSHFWVCLGFWAILGLDYTGYWFGIFLANISKFVQIQLGYRGYGFWDFLVQNFKIWPNSVFWISTPPPNIKFIILESRLEGYAVTIIKILTIFSTFGFFGLLGYSGLRLYWLLILRFFWVKISKSVKIQFFDWLPP